MRTDTPVAIHLKDYTAPDWAVETVHLAFDLNPARTLVHARLALRATVPGDAPVPALRLDGEDLDLRAIALDGKPLDPGAYVLGEAGLEIPEPPRAFTLETTVAVAPQANTKLEGLYRSSGTYCTQCEAEGFRRITYFPDRPDVLARYRVTLRAPRADCPVLLSNGNLVETGPLEGDRHYAVWDDPFPKPSYLFALVAGDLAEVADRFVTASGREVALKLWVEHGNEPQAGYAMDALKRAMAWDETRFGLEYDLDVYNVVAVSDFNMGAMENKSLNLFNAKYVLADAETATDGDFAAIESIVAHEYFHNWTGNRVTCRDWFQLSLKEGLTVFRDQEFSADMRSRPVQRISDVRMLRARQFPEDAGPLAHPVRPASYIEINNFYTATVYEKGAEVIRMLHTLLGEAGFQAGMRLYIARHDGQAATCDDFVAAMADATGRDLDAFKAWYAQAGTPRLGAHWDGPTETGTGAGTATLRLSQTTAPTPGQERKAALHMPVRVAWIGPDGAALETVHAGARAHEHVLELTEAAADFRFEGVPAGAVPSLNRGFSAPVILDAAHGEAERVFLMGHDSDPFARWEAGQETATRLVLDHLDAPERPVPDAFLDALARGLTDERLDPDYRAQLIAPPSLAYLADRMEVVDYDALDARREALRRAIGGALAGPLRAAFDAMAADGPYRPDPDQAGRRALRAAALGFLTAARDGAAARLAKQVYDAADNMTDAMAALTLLADMDAPERDAALAHFHDRFQANPLVLDKWFSLQAMANRPNALATVKGLMAHEGFSLRNPNRVRALIGAFAVANPLRFHQADGSGYAFLADQAIALDAINPQVAARLLTAFGRWKRFDPARQRLMRAALTRVAETPGLSRDSLEIAGKTLEG